MSANKGFYTRVQKELKHLKETKPHGIEVLLPSDSLQVWEAIVNGPELYEGGIFRIQIYLPETYPLHPPTVRFSTPIYHLNVQPGTGHVCIGALAEDNWVPTRTMEDVLRAVYALMIQPVVENAADQNVLDTYNNDRARYIRNAKTSARIATTSFTGI